MVQTPTKPRPPECQQCGIRPVSRERRDSIFCDNCIRVLGLQILQPPSQDAKDYWARKDREARDG